MALSSIIDTVASAIETLLKKPMASYCFLETADPEGNIVAADGSMVSVVRIDGVRQLMGTDELNEIVREMSLRLSSYLGEPGHAIQVWFSRDPNMSADLLKSLNVPALSVARNLQLRGLEDLLKERERHLSRYITWEGFYMALWTRPAVLSKQELEQVRKTRKAPETWPISVDTQAVWTVARQIHIRHQAFTTSVVADLERMAIRAEVLRGHEALRTVKASIYPDMVNSEWRPSLPGDKVSPRRPEIPGDISHLLCPRLEDQLFDREAEIVNPRIVRIGRYNFANLDMTIGPQDTRPFGALLERLRKMGEFPWRVSFLIEGDGLGGSLQIRNALAGVMGFTNSENKLLRAAVKSLEERKDNDETVVRLRVSFCTWAPAGDLNQIEEQASQMQRAIETWGYCGVSPSSGDPLAGSFSSALALDVASTAPVGAPPLAEVVHMLPWNRDASPWKKGSVLFRTADGRPWPYQPGSSLQNTFIDLISAPPGYAKSVFLNTTNLALCLSPAATIGAGGSKLPLVSIIDIGPSSSGLISLLREALPPERRHEVQYRRLRMIKDHAINPFDTQLGCRHPLPLERAFLVNFLTILGTQAQEDKPPSGLSDLIGMVVDELYKLFDDRSRRGSPRLYTRGESKEVDKAIDRHNIHLAEEEPTWWSVVDTLFAAGDLHAAGLAQRFAVPRVEDLTIVVRKPEVADVYGGARTANGESLIDVFQRMVSSALREYPILTLPTRFDIGESRVVSLDLDEAAPRGGGPADKQTALVYMLARFVLAKDYYLNEEVVALMPEDYQPHHKQRIKRIRETPKRIVYDEFHRTQSTPIVRQQVLIDMREGRKWGVHIALASQLLADFDEDMVNVATGVWIMGVGTDQAAREAQNIFGLSRTATRVVRSQLNGPGPDGAPFLAILNLKDGKHEHLLMNTLGPMELWAFSTTAEDAALRNRLYATIGPIETRARLAKRYPGGSAKSDVEARLARMAEMGHDADEAADGVIDQIVKEIQQMTIE